MCSNFKRSLGNKFYARNCERLICQIWHEYEKFIYVYYYCKDVTSNLRNFDSAIFFCTTFNDVCLFKLYGYVLNTPSWNFLIRWKFFMLNSFINRLVCCTVWLYLKCKRQVIFKILREFQDVFLLISVFQLCREKFVVFQNF